VLRLRGGGALNRPGGCLGVRATPGKVCAQRMRRAVGLKLESGSATGAGLGMTGGPRQSAAAGAGEERSGLAASVGRLGRVAALGCAAQVSQSKQLEGRQRTSSCWATNKNGPEEGKAEGEEKRV
jgi:hypothetical protein